MRPKTDETLPPQKPPRKIGCYQFGCLGLIAILAFIILMPSVHREVYRNDFIACKEKLANIRTGLEAHLTEEGNLKNIDPYGNHVCNWILAGYNKATECENLGLIKKRVDSVCRPGYKVKMLRKDRYEITGVSRDRHGVRICVTETTVSPEDYNEGKRNPNGTKCVH